VSREPGLFIGPTTEHRVRMAMPSVLALKLLGFVSPLVPG